MKEHTLNSFFKTYKNLQRMPYYQILDIILDNLNLKTIEDVERRLVFSYEFPFVKESDMYLGTLFHVACQNAINQITETHLNKKQFFFHENHLSGNEDVFKAYINFFPKRCIMYTSDIYHSITMPIEHSRKKLGCCQAYGNDFLKKYILYKDQIASGDLYLFPQTIFQSSPKSKYVSVPTLAKHKNKIFVDSYSTKIDIIPKTDYGNLIIELPWLRNARIEDFIELREKHKTEYARFQLKTDEIMLSLKENASIEKVLAKEYSEAVLEIKSKIINKKDELKRKGLSVTLGTICTVVPMIFAPQIAQYVNPTTVSSILGGATLYNGINEFAKFENDERKNPYWILYKWEEKTNKS